MQKLRQFFKFQRNPYLNQRKKSKMMKKLNFDFNLFFLLFYFFKFLKIYIVNNQQINTIKKIINF